MSTEEKPKFQLTLIDDNSEEFYVEWLGDDGKQYRAAFPVRDNNEYPDQHAYAVAQVETLLGEFSKAKPEPAQQPEP